jgi:hypothetical protein
MGLVRQAASRRDLTERDVRGQHQALGTLHASTHEVAMRRIAEADSERATEVVRTQSNKRRELFDCDRRLEISLDMCCDFADLPRRQATAG